MRAIKQNSEDARKISSLRVIHHQVVKIGIGDTFPSGLNLGATGDEVPDSRFGRFIPRERNHEEREKITGGNPPFACVIER